MEHILLHQFGTWFKKHQIVAGKFQVASSSLHSSEPVQEQPEQLVLC